MGVSRRGFLTLMAGAGTGVLFTPLPWKMLDDAAKWSQNWSWIPRNIKGDSTYIPVISKTCPSSAAAVARVVGNNPVRLLPDATHPLGGGLTTLTAAEVEMLYSPSRVTKPLKRGKNGFVETTWEDAAQTFFGIAQKAGSKSAFVTGDEFGTTSEILSAFAHSLGSDDVFFMPSEGTAAASASSLMGINGQLGYDFENSDFILSIGANLLETWGTVVSTRKSIFKRVAHEGQESPEPCVLAYASPVQNNTSSAAKYWLPILPGTEEVLALGIANELIRRGKTVNADDFVAYKALCAKYPLDKASEVCGISVESLSAVIDALFAAKAPVVIAGSGGALGTGSAPIVAAMGINALLSNINKKGGVKVLPYTDVVVKGAKNRSQIYSRAFSQWLFSQEDAHLLVLNEANPVFAIAGGQGVVEALNKIPYKVAFTPYMTETASLCDLVLPVAPGLERYDDVSNPYGFAKSIYGITHPVKSAGESVRHIGDVLALIAKNLGKALDYAKSEDVFYKKAESLGANKEDLAKGVPFVDSKTVAVYNVKLRPDMISKAIDVEKEEGPLKLAITTRLSFGTPNIGIPPFNTKTIRAEELKGSDMFVAVNSATASKLGLKENTKVQLTSSNGSLIALLHISEAVRTDTVVATYGLGHTAFDAFSKNKGANILEIIKSTTEPLTGHAVWAKASVSVTKA